MAVISWWLEWLLRIRKPFKQISFLGAWSSLPVAGHWSMLRWKGFTCCGLMRRRWKSFIFCGLMRRKGFTCGGLKRRYLVILSAIEKFTQSNHYLYRSCAKPKRRRRSRSVTESSCRVESFSWLVWSPLEESWYSHNCQARRGSRFRGKKQQMNPQEV